jgi:hypothetical protein
MKWLKISAIGTVLIIVFIATFNFIYVLHPASTDLSSDPRNEGIKYNIHLQYYLNIRKLVIDIKAVPGDKSMTDVFRSFLQIAESLKDKQFSRVILSCAGTAKFSIEGDYFKTLGAEYSTQNPVYTIRTFPQNVDRLNGDPAFISGDIGGLLGGLTDELSNFNKFNAEWFKDDLIGK